MLSAFARLLTIAAVTIFLTVLAVFAIRYLGLRQTFAAPPHPWFEKPYWNIYAPDACSGKLEIPDPTWIVQISVRGRNGAWVLDCPNVENPPKITEILEKSAHKDWLLKIRAVEVDGLDLFIENVGAHDKTKMFAIYAPSQKAARYIRKKSPQWLYAADSAALLRLQVFGSLWIETAIDFWPDFVIANDDPTYPAQLSPRLTDEMIRRHKRVIWEERDNSSAPSIPIDGILTTRPNSALLK